MNRTGTSFSPCHMFCTHQQCPRATVFGLKSKSTSELKNMSYFQLANYLYSGYLIVFPQADSLHDNCKLDL